MTLPTVSGSFAVMGWYDCEADIPVHVCSLMVQSNRDEWARGWNACNRDRIAREKVVDKRVKKECVGRPEKVIVKAQRWKDW